MYHFIELNAINMQKLRYCLAPATASICSCKIINVRMSRGIN